MMCFQIYLAYVSINQKIMRVISYCSSVEMSDLKLLYIATGRFPQESSGFDRGSVFDDLAVLQRSPLTCTCTHAHTGISQGGNTLSRPDVFELKLKCERSFSVGRVRVGESPEPVISSVSQ